MLSYQDRLIDIILKINGVIKINCFEFSEKNIKLNKNVYENFFENFDDKITEVFEEDINIGINKIILRKLLKQYYKDKLNKLKKIKKYSFNDKLESEIFLDLYLSKILDYKELLSLIYPYCSQDNFFIYLFNNKMYFFKIYQLLFFLIVVYYLIT
jgi:hypothetical protein